MMSYQKLRKGYNLIKKNKIPRNKSNQGVKDLYSENYMTLMKEIKVIPTDGEIYHALGLEESIL